MVAHGEEHKFVGWERTERASQPEGVAGAKAQRGTVRGVGAQRGKGDKERKGRPVELVRVRSRDASLAVGWRLTQCQ